jgi:hypothetical protein
MSTVALLTNKILNPKPYSCIALENAKAELGNMTNASLKRCKRGLHANNLSNETK